MSRKKRFSVGEIKKKKEKWKSPFEFYDRGRAIMVSVAVGDL